jgi:predicted MFS family arabinose efflux permease
MTMACYGAGMLAGALASPRLIAALPFGRAVQLGPVAGLAAAACMAATLALPSLALAALCFFLLGSGPMVWTITTTTLRQHVTPDGLLGRVSSVFLTVNAGARPIGAALGGWVGRRHLSARRAGGLCNTGGGDCRLALFTPAAIAASTGTGSLWLIF